MRYFSMEKVLKEKHSDNLRRMQFRMISLNKRTREGWMVLKQMKVMRDDLEVLAEGRTAQARV